MNGPRGTTTKKPQDNHAILLSLWMAFWHGEEHSLTRENPPCWQVQNRWMTTLWRRGNGRKRGCDGGVTTCVVGGSLKKWMRQPFLMMESTQECVLMDSHAGV
ncbi:uncharacterized protein LOC140708366 [Pogona vitticeps]